MGDRREGKEEEEEEEEEKEEQGEEENKSGAGVSEREGRIKTNVFTEGSHGRLP